MVEATDLAEVAARREVLEETGLEVTTDELADLSGSAEPPSENSELGGHSVLDGRGAEVIDHVGVVGDSVGPSVPLGLVFGEAGVEDPV